tara:strand:+ start:1729 stop:3042 length:1314 start_codon:yes stop_codon:yes gene_type:complete
MRILIVLFIFLFISCENDNKTIFFGGKILNKSADKIILNKDDDIINESSIDENGFFQMKLDSINSGLYNFFLQPEFQYIILEKNDSIYIRLNSLDFDESLVFMGNGASKNNFLMDVFLNFEKNEEMLNTSFNESFENYIKELDSVLSVQENKFIEFKSKVKISEFAEKMINNAILYPYMEKLQSFILRRNINEELWDNIRNDFKINFNDNDLTFFKPYIDFIYLYTFNITRIKNKEIDKIDFQIERLNTINELISNNEIKSKLFRFLAFEVLLKNKSIYEKSKFIDEFLKISDFKNINNEVDELYKNQKKLTPGNDFPLVYFANQNGSILDITMEEKSKKVLFFWSYDQNSHLNAIHEKILKLKNIYFNYKFYSININDSQSKWLDNIISNDVINIRSVNFDEMSKKLIIDNLNKIFFLNEKSKIQKTDLIDNLILN